MKYSEDPVLDRRCKQYLRNRKRRQRKEAPKDGYRCSGGPWDGAAIWIANNAVDRCTARLSINGQRGVYRVHGKLAYWYADTTGD